MTIKAPKYPRVQVSASRHIKLASEARKKKITITQLAEQKFSKAR